jgi:hypothetical protein
VRVDQNWGYQMKTTQLAVLRFFALLFLLPGLGGLIVSAMISTHYLDAMPRGPMLDDGRIVPREIHGIVVYQTPAENRRLNLIEYSSVGVFVIGLGLGLVYLEKWGSLQSRAREDDGELLEDRG